LWRFPVLPRERRSLLVFRFREAQVQPPEDACDGGPCDSPG
jgi:hypothetical protein